MLLLVGAAFDAGEIEKARELADQVAEDGPAVWRLESTLADCRTAAKQHEKPYRSELLRIVAEFGRTPEPKAVIAGS